MRTRSFHPVMTFITCMLMLFGLASGCVSDPVTTDQTTQSVTTNPNPIEEIDTTTTTDTAIGEYELQLIEQAYGDLSKEEWEELYDAVDQMSTEAFEAWINAMEAYVGQMNDGTSELAHCSVYWGSKIGYGNFAYSTSSSYSHLWNTNCWMFEWSQCGADLVLSFWMGPDYRGNQGKLKAYASNGTARWYLSNEGGYAGEIWGNGTYYNFYGCWPIEGSLYAGYAQLKQLN